MEGAAGGENLHLGPPKGRLSMLPQFQRHEEDNLEAAERREAKHASDTTGNVENEQAHEPRGPTALPTKPSIWNPSEARNCSHRENLVL